MRLSEARIAVVGGCVTRDPFGQYDVMPAKPHRYFARSALASATCPVPFPDVDLSPISSPFQREMVRQDLRGELGRWVPEGDFDLLVMDLVPERNQLFVAPDGAVATRTSELMAARPDVTGWTLVRPVDAEFFDRWATAWERLVAALDVAGARDRVRVNRIAWATRFAGPGAEFSTYHSPQRIRRSNVFLERAYDRMAQDLAPEQFYRYSDDELLAATEHQWGPAPYHYTPAFYDRFVAHLADDLGS